MKKMKSTLPNMVVVLVIVAIVASGVLAWVHKATEAPKQAVAQQSLNNDIKAVMGGKQVKEICADTIHKSFDGKDYEFIVHDVEYTSGDVAGKAVESTEMGFGGKLIVLVGLDLDGNILGYAIRQTSETPGLGVKAADWFQKGGKGDIIGMNPLNKNFTVSKDGGEVDAITASTITSRAFLKAVKNAAEAVSNSK